MATAKDQSIVVVGTVALDSVQTPAGHRDDCLGGSASYFGVSSSYFTTPRVVAAVGEDFPEPYLDLLRSRGVNLEGLARVEGAKTFRWRGRYGDNLNEAQTLDTQLNVIADHHPVIPENARGARILFLGNIDPVLQLEVLEQMAQPHMVALDTMNFWITGHRDNLEKVLSRIDVLIINDGEAELLSGERNVVLAAERIRGMGPRTVIIKRGEYGSMVFHPDGMFIAPAFPLRQVVDPTGAGDTFAGGLMGYLACSEDPSTLGAMKRGILAGTAMASFTCEGFSLDRLVALEQDSIDARIAELTRLSTL